MWVNGCRVQHSCTLYARACSFRVSEAASMPPACPSEATAASAARLRCRFHLVMQRLPYRTGTCARPAQANPGDIELRVGDVLLLDTGAGFK